MTSVTLPTRTARAAAKSLLLLAALACGESSLDPNPEATPDPEPPHDADPNRLLSDDELVTEPDPSAAAVEPLWASWIEANAVPIRSLTSTNTTDLEFLRSAIEDRRVVQLGESAHGVAQYHRVKTRIIRYLHEELGFDVLAFESSLYGCWRANHLADPDATSADVLRACLFSVWHVEEAVPLFEYILETWASSDPLVLAGFDIQTGPLQLEGRAALLEEIVRPVDSALADQIVRTESEFKELYDSLSTRIPLTNAADVPWIDLYRGFEEFFAAERDALLAAHAGALERYLVARQVVRSMVLHLEMLDVPREDRFGRISARDPGLAENLQFLVDELYPSSRVMTWGHNFHLRHDNESVENDFPGRTMGSWTFERYADDLYTIGLYMYRGTGALNDRSVYDMTPASPNSLEAILYRARLKHLFVDLESSSSDPGASWMTVPITAKRWGTVPLGMTVRDQYDGIVFIDTVTPPTYLN